MSSDQPLETVNLIYIEEIILFYFLILFSLFSF